MPLFGDARAELHSDPSEESRYVRVFFDSRLPASLYRDSTNQKHICVVVPFMYQDLQADYC